MRLRLRPIAIAVSALLLAACEGNDRASAGAASAEAADMPPAASPSSSAGSDAPAGIEWFAGDLDEAFSAARASDEPVLLYWGAEWCPYCADLEAHVFSREDVKQKLELFVPVYLDGDEPGAQRWGDVFGVAGYPTVLALRPDRTELARIAGGMPLSVYAEMLDLVLADLRPIDDVLATAETRAPSADDCRRLAYNGWLLDDAASGQTAQLAASLAVAAERCAAAGEIDQARLVAYAASFAVAAESDEVRALAEELVRKVRGIVTNRELAVSIFDVLRELGEQYFAAAKALEPDGGRQLLDDWVAVMDAASIDSRYGYGDRLGALRSKVEAVTALDPAGIPPSMVDDARRRIDEALDEVGRSPARAGTVNAAINLLVAVGDLEKARGIAEHELERSRTPYYHMADLAWIDEMLGRHDEAIEWLERAYRASEGPATRFQWGTSYVRGLLRMAPEDEQAIHAAAHEVLGELDGPARIYRRSRGRLETLDASLREWNSDGAHDAVISALRERMTQICAGIPHEEADAQEACTAFLTDRP